MIVRIGRLAGAILIKCEEDFLLVGNTKEPCDWEQHGFKVPREIDARTTPVLPLERLSASSPATPKNHPHLFVRLTPKQNAEGVARVFAERFLIVRNASVSDRLWNLVIGESNDAQIEATWLLNMPDAVWQVVRDTVLKCT